MQKVVTENAIHVKVVSNDKVVTNNTSKVVTNNTKSSDYTIYRMHDVKVVTTFKY